MTTACIVQARLGSTRLPAKVLLPLPTGRCVLQEVLFRCEQIEGVDVVVAAIPDTSENDILVPFIERIGTKIVRGPEHDVLARYVKAAEAVNADIIMRITADCPLIDPQVCGKVLQVRQDEDTDYACNNIPPTHPRGLDCEAFTMDLLRRTNLEAPSDFDREHVSPYMRTTSFWPPVKRSFVRAEANRSHIRWTLDTLSDYITIWKVFEDQMRAAG